MDTFMFRPQQRALRRAIACALAILACVVSTASLTAADRPNILYIFTDDQSFRSVSCYPGAYHYVHTPNIDALAERGVRFDQAYTGAKCVPSRATQLTGRLQFACTKGLPEVMEEKDRRGKKYYRENPDAKENERQPRWWQATLRDNGYYTAMIGKFHWGAGAEAHQHGIAWDWSRIWDHGAYGDAGGYYYDQFIMIDGQPQVPLEGYSTDRYTEFTVEFINERAKEDKPWFMWLAYAGVHSPYTPADRHKQLYLDKPPVDIPVDIFGPRPGKPEFRQGSAWKEGKDGMPTMKGQTLDFWTKQQDQAIASIDEGVGKIVKALEETGQLDNTIIVFTSDQGYVWGHHGFKGKILPYVDSIKSPLIVSNPKRFPQSKVCISPVNGADLVRSFHAWAETEPDDSYMPLTGRDITPLCKDPESTDLFTKWNQIPTMMTYTKNTYDPYEIARRLKFKQWEVLGPTYYFMILDGNYKYTRYLTEDAVEELYHVHDDFNELDNLAVKPEYKDKLVEMRKQLRVSLKLNAPGEGGELILKYLEDPK